MTLRASLPLKVVHVMVLLIRALQGAGLVWDVGLPRPGTAREDLAPTVPVAPASR